MFAQTVIVDDESTFHLRVEADQVNAPTDVGSQSRQSLRTGLRLAGFVMLIGGSALAMHFLASPADSSGSRNSLRYVPALASYVPTGEGRTIKAFAEAGGAASRLPFHPSMSEQEDLQDDTKTTNRKRAGRVGGKLPQQPALTLTASLSRRDLMRTVWPGTLLAGIALGRLDGLPVKLDDKNDGRLEELLMSVVDGRIEQLEQTTSVDDGARSPEELLMKLVDDRIEQLEPTTSVDDKVDVRAEELLMKYIDDRIEKLEKDG